MNTTVASQPMTADLVARLAQEIRRVDGSHSLGAGALAEALAPFVEREAASALRSSGEAVAWHRRVKPDSGKWLAWEYFAGAVDYDNDPAKFPHRVGRWECEYRPLYTTPLTSTKA